jgi:hypothetical protein
MKRIYRITDNLIKIFIDPTLNLNTEIVIYYIKEKIKNVKKRNL